MGKSTISKSGRTSTFDKSRGRSGSFHSSLPLPDRGSTPQHVHPSSKLSARLIYGYMVCGLNRDPAQWSAVVPPVNGKVQRIPGNVGPFFKPHILGSIPPMESNEEIAQVFVSALQVAFPNDAEICIGLAAPEAQCHTFVLQNYPSRTIYGVVLRLWVKAGTERSARIIQRVAPGSLESNLGGFLWIPYCLTYLSLYPVYDLLGDYIRCSWLLWCHDLDQFNKASVIRLLQILPPKPERTICIDMGKHSFFYKVPTHSSEFQNFSLWPLFACLSTGHIVALLETALYPKGRIIFMSSHLAMLTVASETLRFYTRPWAGLYVPVVYGAHAESQVNEPAPYILGIPKQCRPLFTAPRDALLVDLDADRIFTSEPPRFLSRRQREACTALFDQACAGRQLIDGVPQHLRSAYGDDSRFRAIGNVLTAEQSKPVLHPFWWNSKRTASAVRETRAKIERNLRHQTLWNIRQPFSTKIRIQDLAEIKHDRSHLARSLNDSWTYYIAQKKKTDLEAKESDKRHQLLNSQLGAREKEIAELSECTEQLIEKIKQLQSMVKELRADQKCMSVELQDKTLHAKQLSNHVSELQMELSDANNTLIVQQQLLEEIEMSRKTAVTSSSELDNRHRIVMQQRDNAQRAVIHLTSLISSQLTFIERVMTTFLASPNRSKQRDVGDHTSDRSRKHRSFSPLGTPESQRRLLFASQSPTRTPTKVPSNDSKRHTADLSHGPASGRSSPVHRLSLLTQSTDREEGQSFMERVGLVSDAIRMISEQCSIAVKDLATTEEDPSNTDGHDEMSPQTPVPSMDHDNEALSKSSPASGSSALRRKSIDQMSALSRTPSLDSRASTALSGSVIRPHHREWKEETHAVQTTAILEETEAGVSLDPEHFMKLDLVNDPKTGAQDF